MDLGDAENVSEQAMGDLVDQCEDGNLVRRGPHPHDKRAKLIQFAPDGLAWLGAFERAVAQAQHEFQTDVGTSVATVTTLGLEVYTAGTL